MTYLASNEQEMTCICKTALTGEPMEEIKANQQIHFVQEQWIVSIWHIHFLIIRKCILQTNKKT